MLHGAVHNNPDYVTNYGWISLKEGYEEIKRMVTSHKSGEVSRRQRDPVMRRTPLTADQLR